MVLIVNLTSTYANENLFQLKDTLDSYTLSFTLPPFSIETINDEITQYNRIKAPGLFPGGESGRPQLPMTSFNLQIPTPQLLEPPKASVTKTYTRKIFLTHHLLPNQKPLLTNDTHTQSSLFFDSVYYSTTSPFQSSQLVSFSDPYSAVGTHGITAFIHPFSYDPHNKCLTVVDSFSVSISNLEKRAPQRSPSHLAQPLKSLYLNTLHSPKSEFESFGIAPIQEAPTSESNYLIITPLKYLDTLMRFVDYKDSTGYTITWATTEAIGQSTGEIKTFIQAQYDTPSTRPIYLLLVGDADDIPAWFNPTTDDTPETDLYYSTLEGTDSLPDLFMGRFAISNTTELSNLIEKTIFMDQHLSTIPKKTSFVATFDKQMNYMTGNVNYVDVENTHNEVIDNIIPPDYQSNKRYIREGARGADLINDINSGIAIALYSGHGSPTYLSDNAFVLNNNNVRSASNTTSYPLILSLACNAAKFTETLSLAEMWIRGEWGASAFFGASAPSYFGYDDTFEKQLFTNLFSDQSQNRIGIFTTLGKINFYTTTPQLKVRQRYLEIYNTFGDPSLAVTQNQSNTIHYYATYISGDDHGNKNGILNPGDTADVSISLKNLSLYDQSNVYARMSTTTPGINILTDTSHFAHLANGSITESDTPFTISVLNTVLTPSEIQFELYLTDSISFNDTLTFTTTVYASSTIQGTIYAQGDQAPLTNWTVYFSGPTSGTTQTNNLGKYTIHAINGEYEIQVLNDQHYSSDTKSVTIPLGTPTETNGIDIYVQKAQLTPSHAAIVTTVSPHSILTIPTTITNTGENPLSLSLSKNDNVFPSERVCTKEADNYCAIESQSSFIWNDIKRYGTVLTSLEDCISCDTLIPLPFTFRFYDNYYDSVYVMPSGLISFSPFQKYYTSTICDFSAQTAGTVQNVIAPFFAPIIDHHTGAPGIYYYSDTTQFVIQYDSVSIDGDPTATYTFQSILFPNGIIEYRYKEIAGPTNRASIGIQNSDYTQGLSIGYEEASLPTNNSSFTIYPPQQLLQFRNLDTTLSVFDSYTLTTPITPLHFPSNIQTDTLYITHNDPEQENPLPLPFSVLIIPDIITLSQSSLKFNPIQVTEFSELANTIVNSYSEEIEISSIHSDNPLFYVTHTGSQLLIPQGASPFSVTFNPVTEGYFSTVITITATIVSSGIPLYYTLTAYGYGVENRDIVPSPSAVSFVSTEAGHSVTNNLSLYNPGSANLTIDSLVLSNNQFSATTQSYTISSQSALLLDVSFSPSTSGVFKDTLTVYGEWNNPIKIPLSATGYSKPLIQMSLDTITVTLTSGPQTEAFTITNSQGDILSYDIFDLFLPSWMTLNGTNGQLRSNESDRIDITINPLLVPLTTTIDSLQIYSNSNEDFTPVYLKFIR